MEHFKSAYPTLDKEGGRFHIKRAKYLRTVLLG
jgi:hypothetical protein